ncbi:MAG: phage major capsid protein [Spirochaetaceae bacterium]|nr:phage major capsid protein [Spirochaetaceae bacterium]
MTTVQRLQVEASQIRERINATFDGADDLTDEQRAELDGLTTRAQHIERELRAAIVAEGDGDLVVAPIEADAEARERLELRSRATLTGYLTAALSGRQVGGAEAELQQAAGVDGIPCELWDTAPMETRADAVTAAPGTTGVNLDRLQPAVFAPSVGPTLGVEMPMVESGSYATGTIDTSLTAGAKAAGADAEATAATFTMSSVTPKRISARLAIRIEDVAAVGAANFEAILRENASLVLSDALDDALINGDGQAPNVRGMFAALTDPDAPTEVATFDSFAAVHASGIDGLWAVAPADVLVVVGPATAQTAAKTFQSASNYKGELSAAAYAAANTGGMVTNARMPKAAANVQQGLLYRKGRMGLRTAVCPHWADLQIDDIYSGSARGERYFSLHALVGDVVIVQAAAYAQVAYKLA